jgi:8-oxo-dGTP pyrophosphatase MutT (NUDIX family)
MTQAALTRDASTLVLLRDSAHGPEIFFVKRNTNASFMGGAFVFPGGRVDDGDQSPALLSRLHGFVEQPGLSGDSGRALVVAALRETFEEAGVLLVVEQDGTPADLSSPERTALVAEVRARVLRGEVAAFGELLDTLKLSLDAGALSYFARWITPEAEPKRFDARFFVSLAPAAQEASHDQQETTEGRWLRPEEALALHEKGEVFLAPPTFRTLEAFCGFGSAAKALAARRPDAVPVVRPFLRLEEDGSVSLLLDHDPEHPSPGEGPFLEGPSRIVSRQGRWWSRAGGRS